MVGWPGSDETMTETGMGSNSGSGSNSHKASPAEMEVSAWRRVSALSCGMIRVYRETET